MSTFDDELRDQPFARLTTFRRTGEPVGTAMWFALDGQDLVLSTPAGAGKLKRLAHTTRVQLQACTRTGEPLPDAPVTEGVCRVVTSGTERAHVERLLAHKYGLQWRVILGVESALSLVRRRRRPEPRVALVVTPVPSPA